MPKVADWISTVTKEDTSATPRAFGHVAEHRDPFLARLHLVAHDLELIGEGGIARADLLRHAQDRLVERLARLDADKHHVEAVGEAGDLVSCRRLKLPL